jgi:hypothetical protein
MHPPYSDFNAIGREYRAAKLQCAQSPLFRMLADDLLRSQSLPLRGERYTDEAGLYCALSAEEEAGMEGGANGKQACVTLVMRKGKGSGWESGRYIKPEVFERVRDAVNSKMKELGIAGRARVVAYEDHTLPEQLRIDRQSTVWYRVHTARCTLHTARCTLHTAHCTHCTHYRLHTAHGTLHTAHCTSTVHCTLH